MLESLAAWVLRTYVGEYVENLNTDQLSIGYGTVDLHNLPLKKTALKGLELPLEVKSGFIGHLQLSIPLRRPKSEPWIVHINKLYLVAGPLKHSEYNEEEEKERERTRKKKRLDALEGQWLAGRNENSGGFWSGSWWPSLYSSFSTTIVENLQLVISDVHFRYEDATTRESVPFSFGITIEKLSAHSTNENWNPEEIIQNERTIKYKLIELQKMAIYWDTDVTLVGDLPSRDLENALQRMINRNQGEAGFCKHQYILEPTSAQAKLKRNSSALPLRSREMPRFVVDVHVEKIPLSLEEAQYKMLIVLIDGFERHFRQRHYFKWRPRSPIRNNAREWWKFAFTCIMEPIKERTMHRTWSFAVKRARDVVKYVNLYSQHLISGSVEPSIKEEQNRIEDELTFEELVVLRYIAQTRAETEISKQMLPDSEVQDLHKKVQDQATSASEGASGGWQGWLTGWYSWYGTDTTDGRAPGTTTKNDTSQMFMGEPPTTKEEEEFLGELADSHLSESIFNRDQVFAQLNFRLDTGSFKLVNTKQSNSLPQITALLPVVEVEFSDLSWASEMRPRSSTWEFSMSLGALFVRDKLTTGTLFPALVCPQGRESQKVSLTKRQQATVVKGSVEAMVTSAATLGLNILQDMNDPVFKMKFESLPPASKVGYRLSVTTQPLDVVYNPTVLNHIAEFFSHTSMEGAQALYIERQLREVARVRYEELKNQTRHELVQTLDTMMDGSDVGHSKRWDIQLDISAPRFLVPESFQDKKASVVLIDFGHLSFANTQALNRKKTISEGQDSKPEMEDDSFVTPPSTPPVEKEEEFMSISDTADGLLSGVSNQTILEKMYERYTLDLSDIQMVVCNVKENWSEVASKPFLTSDAHVVEKFTISIQLERRLLFTADPLYPAVNLHAKLPSLVLHINEHKLQTLTKCVKQLSRPKASNPTPPPMTQQRIIASSTPLPHVASIEQTETEGINTDVKFQVLSLTLTLSKTRYPIAKVNAFGLSTEVNMNDENFVAKGRLSSISVTDMSPHGSLYREKFTTFGDEALSFNFLKYGAPDPDLQRENDMSLKLRMSSVRYVHTKRFQTELVVFFQHFLQLQEVLGRMRAASEGNEVSWMFGRGSRVALDIKAGNPVVLVPRSAKSSHMLVADLGNLTVNNSFLWKGPPDTLPHSKKSTRQRASSQADSGHNDTCLLDSMHIELVDMDLFTATRVQENNQQSPSKFSYKSQGLKLLKEKCKLTLTVERNLDGASSKAGAVPDFNFSGCLSSLCASLDYSQYCFILGMLGENFGEPLEEFERPSSVIQDPLGKPPEEEKVWTVLRMNIDLVNVSLELLPFQLFEHPEDNLDHAQLPSLARIDFIKSKFEFESFSDWSKTIDLVSQEVIFEDMRQKGMDLDDSDSCIFTGILLPRKLPASTKERENSLQFEVHYRDTTSKTLLTFLFNHSRIMLIIDYLLDTYNFIMCRMFKPSTAEDSSMDVPEDDGPAKPYETPPPSASGVATRCEMPAQPQPQKTFEMKVNISGTELVVLENVNTMDTHAVVLKITAVLAWRPHLQSQKWLSCSIQNLEMFSCVLSCEEETALSIIDPTSALVELNNSRRQKGRKNAGLLDITEEQLPSLEINLPGPLTMRVSYNDYKLYLSILDSVSKQLNKAIKSEVNSNVAEEVPDHEFDAMSVKRLQELGFKEADCIRALQATSGRLEASATWLLENATPIIQAQSSQQQSSAQGWQFAGFEVRAGAVCICLIDDCGDSDVPLIEFSAQNLYFWHDLQSTGDGAAQCTVIVQYYNRNVSDWEPFVEPWKCQLHWQEQRKTPSKTNRFLAKLDAPDRLDVTVTTTLINMIKHTIASWSEDYYRPDPSPVSAVASTETPSLPSSRSDSRHDSLNQTTSTESPLSSPTVSRPESSASLWSTGSGFPRRRSPFVPFVLRNQTGCEMWFKTVTTTPSKVILKSTGQALPGLPGPWSEKISDWSTVSPGGEAPFEFTSGEKLRHRDTHEFNVHQVIVQVEGWASLSPVSVDRVGTFFRQARPQEVANKSPGSDLQPARVVFDVSLEGRARKVVTVRSALTVKNKMDLPMEIRMQGLTSMQGTLSLPVVSPESSVAIPLRCTSWQLYLRPYGMGVGFCSQPVEWRRVLRSHSTKGCARECYALPSSGQPEKKFRFCVAVKREGYPEEIFHHEGAQTSGLNVMPQPGHTLTIMYPVMLVNLLPCELSYQVKNTPAKGNLKAGKSVPLYTADPEKALDLGFSIENFTYCDNIRISRRMSFIEHPIIHVELQDTERRSLILNVKVSVKPGGSLKVSIYAPYWMINSTGIPLVFKQEGGPHDMAGQFKEHEMARSLTPLLFSFSDREAATRCQMRIGKGYQPGSGKPLWSTPFSLDNSREFRRVHAIQGGSRPNKVYDIGIDVRFGQGRYRDTRIVTLATRYQLENRTHHTLAFSQRHFVREQGTTNPEGTLTAMPGALVLFHWPRTDLDQLLCIRLNDVSHCKWSGGFRIDQDDSFHINMRSLNDCSLFVRVEVVLRGATFHVLFTDASQLPPPFRIDNLSEVSITFYQCGTEDRTRTILQAKQSVPYSWDEPTLLPELSVGVMGGGSFTRYQMNELGGSDRLYYYNPIYVVLTHTFSSADGHMCGSVHLQPAVAADESSLDMRELVLDVPQGSAVLLRRKEPLKRSQLWRLTGQGQLRHEGSSTPSVKPSSSNGGLVLDIDSLAPPTCDKYVRLVLSKYNQRRLHSQTWSFTEDNRMKCDFPGLYVQPRGGVKGLRDGVDAVLGPANITKNDQIPIEQCISTCKLRPGSGCLRVKVLADGPTRVLQITDCLQQSEDEAEKEWMLVERKGGLRQPTVSSLGNEGDCSALEVHIRLAGGIGVSVINSVPEELVFINLEQIEVDYLRSSKLETLEGSIGRIQIDNQVFASQLPVLLFPSFPEKGSKEETMSKQPSLRVSASKEPSRLPNVEIFKTLDISLRKMTLQIEELLLLKLLQFFGYVQQDDDIVGANQEEDECLYATQRPTLPSSSGSLKRYYFEHLQLNSTQIKLSVSSAGRLPEDLQSLKSSLGLMLVNLEDATVDLETFSRSHPFDTLSSHLDSIGKHYTDEVFSQKIAIVGSVNMLGNPMGLLNDVSSGLEGLVRRGNVGGLFINVAHGVSDSAAKLTGSLSDGLWNASMDSKFQESRDAMRAERFSSSKDHFVAGVKGLGMGIVGGLTSIVTQPIEGAHNAGLSGFISGIGKGIVGTVTKPTAGVLDFASGAAAAVRGQATRSSRYFPPKQARLRRNCFGPSGAIPRFSRTHAEGQEIMLKLNEGNFNEKFVLSESVRRDKEDRLKAIVSTEAVYFVRARGIPSPEAIVLLVRFSDLFVCQPIASDGKDYIELVMKADNSSMPTPSKNPSKRPRVRCDDNVISQKVAQKINYAKNLYDEVQQTVKLELKEPTSPV